MGPDVAEETLKDAKIQREMIRTAALYVINKCQEEDKRKHAEIMAKGTEKEKEEWSR